MVHQDPAQRQVGTGVQLLSEWVSESPWGLLNPVKSLLPTASTCTRQNGENS